MTEKKTVKMMPPHHKALRHAGRHIAEGDLVDVAEHEVEAHEREGWKRASKTTAGRKSIGKIVDVAGPRKPRGADKEAQGAAGEKE